jgi:hypothetical protein
VVDREENLRLKPLLIFGQSYGAAEAAPLPSQEASFPQRVKPRPFKP